MNAVIGYGPTKSVQELVEEFTVGLMMLGIVGDMTIKLSEENLLKVINDIKERTGQETADTKPGDISRQFTPTGIITFNSF